MKKIALLPIPCIVFELKLGFGKYNNDTPIVEKPETAEEIMLRFARVQKKNCYGIHYGKMIDWNLAKVNFRDVFFRFVLITNENSINPTAKNTRNHISQDVSSHFMHNALKEEKTTTNDARSGKSTIERKKALK